MVSDRSCLLVTGHHPSATQVTHRQQCVQLCCFLVSQVICQQRWNCNKETKVITLEVKPESNVNGVTEEIANHENVDTVTERIQMCNQRNLVRQMRKDKDTSENMVPTHTKKTNLKNFQRYFMTLERQRIPCYKLIQACKTLWQFAKA